MPVVSKRQAGFMGMIASGKFKKKGLSKKKAKEFLRGVKVKKLPRKAKRFRKRSSQFLFKNSHRRRQNFFGG